MVGQHGESHHKESSLTQLLRRTSMPRHNMAKPAIANIHLNPLASSPRPLTSHCVPSSGPRIPEVCYNSAVLNDNPHLVTLFRCGDVATILIKSILSQIGRDDVGACLAQGTAYPFETIIIVSYPWLSHFCRWFLHEGCCFSQLSHYFAGVRLRLF